MLTNTLAAALAYYERGLCVIPIQQGGKRPPSGLKWKRYQQQRPTPQQLQKWFGGEPRNLAIVLGDVSGGMVCRDFDTPEVYPQWAKGHPELAAALPTAKTKRGYHVYARCELALIRAASPSGGETIDLGDGELRGGGCYVLAPPSIHPDGPVYHWIVGNLAEADAPFVNLADTGWLPCYTEDTEPTEPTVATVAIEDTGSPRITQDRLRESGGESCSHVNVEDLIDAAITRTLPSSEGHRHRAIFEFVRELQAIPELADVDPMGLELIFRRWHQHALPTINTKAFEESWFDFLNGWSKVRYPKGAEPIRQLFVLAKAEPLPPEAERFESEELRWMAALCRQLQIAAGDNPFYLSCRAAGELFGVAHTQANRWLRMLERFDLIKRVATGTRKGRKASTFRYLGAL